MCADTNEPTLWKKSTHRAAPAFDCGSLDAVVRRVSRDVVSPRRFRFRCVAIGVGWPACAACAIVEANFLSEGRCDNPLSAPSWCERCERARLVGLEFPL